MLCTRSARCSKHALPQLSTIGMRFLIPCTATIDLAIAKRCQVQYGAMSNSILRDLPNRSQTLHGLQHENLWQKTNMLDVADCLNEQMSCKGLVAQALPHSYVDLLNTMLSPETHANCNSSICQTKKLKSNCV